MSEWATPRILRGSRRTLRNLDRTLRYDPIGKPAITESERVINEDNPSLAISDVRAGQPYSSQLIARLSTMQTTAPCTMARFVATPTPSAPSRFAAR